MTHRKKKQIPTNIEPITSPSENPSSESQPLEGTPPLQEANSGQKPKQLRQRPYFQPNCVYFTICVYALAVIVIGSFLIYMILNLSDTIAAISHFAKVMSPFFVALFIAFLLNPLVVFFNKQVFYKLFKGKCHSLRKGLSILFAYLFAIGLVTIMVIYVLPQLGESIVDLTERLSTTVPDITKQAISFLENLNDNYPDLDVMWIEKKIQEITPDLIGYATNFLTGLVPAVYSFSVSLAKMIINILLSIVVSCYMLIDKTILAKAGRRIAYALLPEAKVQDYINTARECLNIFTGFITGKTLDSLIIGILCFIIMTILKMPYTLLISVIVGVTNMIPYFGPFIGAVPGALIYLFLSPLQALGFVVMILGLQQFDGLFLGPKILGNSTGLKPLWVIFAITLGGAYGGVLGMFLGVPVLAVIAHLLNQFLHKKLVEKEIPDEF